MFTPERRAVLELMEIGKEYTPMHIAELIGKKRTAVNKIMLKMHRLGMLHQSSYGRYYRTDELPNTPLAMSRNTPCVCLLKCNGVYKIGRSDNPARRVKELQTAMPYDVTIAHIIYADDPAALEAELHERYAGKRLRGEWFALDMFDVDEICAIGASDD